MGSAAFRGGQLGSVPPSPWDKCQLSLGTRGKGREGGWGSRGLGPCGMSWLSLVGDTTFFVSGSYWVVFFPQHCSDVRSALPGVPADGWHPRVVASATTEATSALTVRHHRGAAQLPVALGDPPHPRGGTETHRVPTAPGGHRGKSQDPACLQAQALVLLQRALPEQDPCRSGAAMTFWLVGDLQRVSPQAPGLLPAPRAHLQPLGSQWVPTPEQLPSAPRHSAAVRHGDVLALHQPKASAQPGSEVSPPGSSLRHPLPPRGLNWESERC